MSKQIISIPPLTKEHAPLAKAHYFEDGATFYKLVIDVIKWFCYYLGTLIIFPLLTKLKYKKVYLNVNE